MSFVNFKPPHAEKRPTTITQHGVALSDNYAWLKDENWQQVMHDPSVLQPDIRDYLEAENAYAKLALAPMAELTVTLFDEMKARIKEDDASVPMPDGDYLYFTKYVSGGQHPHLCRDAKAGGAAEVILNGDKEAEGQKFFKLAGVTHSTDHSRLAYSVDLNGSEIYVINVRDIATGSDLDDVITGAHGAVEWANDNQTLYYTILDDNHRPCAVMRHALGTQQSDDPVSYTHLTLPTIYSV